jgi:hypothetical protein
MTSSLAAVNFNGRALSPDVVVDEKWFSDPDFCVNNKVCTHLILHLIFFSFSFILLSISYYYCYSCCYLIFIKPFWLGGVGLDVGVWENRYMTLLLDFS